MQAAAVRQSMWSLVSPGKESTAEAGSNKLSSDAAAHTAGGTHNTRQEGQQLQGDGGSSMQGQGQEGPSNAAVDATHNSVAAADGGVDDPPVLLPPKLWTRAISTALAAVVGWGAAGWAVRTSTCPAEDGSALHKGASSSRSSGWGVGVG